MKTSWIIGSVVTGHVAAASFLLMQGCQTVQSKRTVLLGPPSEDAPAAQAQSAVKPGNSAVAPGGRAIPPVSEVGRRGSFKEVVIPAASVTPARSRTPVHAAEPRRLPPLPAVATTYTVAKGDTLGHIAQRHGVSTRDLIRLNNLNEPNKLLVGQKLNIPAATRPRQAAAPAPQAPAGGTTHKIVAGESVSVIAQKYGVRTADVLAANQLSRDSLIRVGQTLVIPGAKAPKAAETSVVSSKPAAAVKTPSAAPVPAASPLPAPAMDIQPIPLPAPAPLPPPEAVAKTPAAPAASDAPAPAEPKYKTYTVKENEDVYTVAIKWGIAPTELRQLNNLTSSELTPGQVLRVPE